MFQLLSLLGIVLVLFWIVTPFIIFNLSARVSRLELAMKEGKVSPQRSEPLRTHDSPSAEMPVTSHEKDSSGPTMGEQIAAWVKEDWLLKMGGLLLLLGCGWLVSYAFLNNWIGPIGRIASGILLGTAVLVLGTWRLQKVMHQGGVFIILGSTIILLTVFAARQMYGFFTPTTALGLMFLSCAYVALVSVKNNYRGLAIASVILAGIAPLLTNSPDANYVALFAYLLVVALGTVWIVSVTDFREVTAVALILVAIYSVPHILSSDPAPMLLLFAYVFAALFFVTNTTGIVRLKDKNLMPDTLTAAANGIFLLAWIMTKAPEVWRSLIISAWMIAFLVAAFAVFKATKKREPFYVYAGVGVAMLAAATAAELSGAALTIAFTIEVAIVSYIAFALIEDRTLAERTCLLFVGPILLSLESIDRFFWSESIFNEHFFVLLLLALVLMGLGAMYTFTSSTKPARASGPSAGLMVAGSLYAFILLWLTLQMLVHPRSAAVMISLFVYTIVGLVTYFFGRVHEQRGLGMYGGVLLGLVIARLLLVDIWEMPLVSRFVTFFVIGILLMSTAFFSRGKSASSLKK